MERAGKEAAMADRLIEGRKEGRRLPDRGAKWSFIVRAKARNAQDDWTRPVS